MHQRTIQRRRAAKWKNKALTSHLGFNVEQIYNLDVTIADFCLPRIKALREHTISYPAVCTYEEWMEVLDAIAEGFDIYVNIPTHTPEQEEKVEKALDLFRMYFRDLWW